MAEPTSTIDPKEIEYHSNLKNDWWNKDGTLACLHEITPFRTEFVRDGLAIAGYEMQNPTLPLEGIKIMDIGCGGGIVSEALAKIGAQITGVDASAELIDIAKKHKELDPDVSKRVNYIHTSIEEFSESNEESYDAVVVFDILEHVINLELFLKECVKILKPGGSIFITTLNKTLSSWFIAIIAAEYITKLIPRGTHDWNKFIAPDDVQRILKNYDCQMKSIRGIKGLPFRGERSWSSSTNVSYGLHAVKRKKTNTAVTLGRN